MFQSEAVRPLEIPSGTIASKDIVPSANKGDLSSEVLFLIL
jgi:hypothetical protein